MSNLKKIRAKLYVYFQIFPLAHSHIKKCIEFYFFLPFPHKWMFFLTFPRGLWSMKLGFDDWRVSRLSFRIISGALTRAVAEWEQQKISPEPLTTTSISVSSLCRIDPGVQWSRRTPALSAAHGIENTHRCFCVFHHLSLVFHSYQKQGLN